MNELSLSTALWSDGIKLILEYMDFRWHQSSNMTESEANVAAMLIGTSPRDPWQVASNCTATVFDAFCHPRIHMLVVMRIQESAICIYVPPAKVRQEGLFYGRSCLAAHTLDDARTVYPLDIVMFYRDTPPTEKSKLWLSDRDTPSFMNSAADLLSIQVDGRYLFRRAHRFGELSNDTSTSSPCSLEWFWIF